jgi:uncharacterized protein YndB with AHSA1/START domain
MHAPNGVEYPMGGEFHKIVAPERLVLACGAQAEKEKCCLSFCTSQHSPSGTAKPRSR